MSRPGGLLANQQDGRYLLPEAADHAVAAGTTRNLPRFVAAAALNEGFPPLAHARERAMHLLVATLLFMLLSGALQAALFGRGEGAKNGSLRRLRRVAAAHARALVAAFLVLPELRTLYMRIVVPLIRPDPAMQVRALCDARCACSRAPDARAGAGPRPAGGRGGL